MYVNPRSDGAFIDRAREALDEGVDSPTALEEHLRVFYPAVGVRLRELAGVANARYVYRDGSWTADE